MFRGTQMPTFQENNIEGRVLKPALSGHKFPDWGGGGGGLGFEFFMVGIRIILGLIFLRQLY